MLHAIYTIVFKVVAQNLVKQLYRLVQGALATAGKYCLNSWAVAKKGPSYPPMFNPLSVVFTVVLGSIFIGDDITVGRSVLRCFSTFSHSPSASSIFFS